MGSIDFPIHDGRCAANASTDAGVSREIDIQYVEPEPRDRFAHTRRTLGQEHRGPIQIDRTRRRRTGLRQVAPDDLPIRNRGRQAPSGERLLTGDGDSRSNNTYHGIQVDDADIGQWRDRDAEAVGFEHPFRPFAATAIAGLIVLVVGQNDIAVADDQNVTALE